MTLAWAADIVEEALAAWFGKGERVMFQVEESGRMDKVLFYHYSGEGL